MNLPPAWAERLVEHGLESTHWSRVGAASDPDRTILDWVHERGFVPVTQHSAHADAIARGALLSIDDRRARVRILPLRERA